jgi:hypothetical protein
MLNAAETFTDLLIPPGNRLESSPNTALGSKAF